MIWVYVAGIITGIGITLFGSLALRPDGKNAERHLRQIFGMFP